MAILTLLAIALLRVVYHDGAFLLIWLNAFTRYTYLPAYACLVWGAWQRRWLLTAASALVVCCHLMWLAPDFLRDRRFDASAAGSADGATTDASPTVRIFFANVAEQNDEHDAMLHEISEANPDVIVLVEYGWTWHRAFKTSPVMAPYRFGSGHLQSHIGSVNVFSRLPLRNEMQNWINGRAMHTVDIAIGPQTLRLIGLHGPRPINQPKYNYPGYWQHAIPLLTAEQGPLVIVGDINATQHSSVYKQLTGRQLRSAHDATGRGYATTWPNGENWLPPIRIDQVFLSPEVECPSIREGRGRGSDHKPLIVDVRIRGDRKTPPTPTTDIGKSL
jgi:endonuclease/exonuclease/phosphatase (EEP) superfamily protein YafD